ncbi:MAG: hypothetical protein Q8O03_04215 [Nanoarchaeota archaeon]|nr:hypothetical protein [Nanoarchaeota archaeon]
MVHYYAIWIKAKPRKKIKNSEKFVLKEIKKHYHGFKECRTQENKDGSIDVSFICTTAGYILEPKEYFDFMKAEAKEIIFIDGKAKFLLSQRRKSRIKELAEGYFKRRVRKV